MLELRDIHYTINEDGVDTGILGGINLSLESGRFYAITGPNGGGKSTLAKIIMGILEPTQGRILFEGQDITGLSIAARAKLGIGYAFQQPPRFRGIKVRELMELAIGHSLNTWECCKYLTRVGLCSADYLDREVNSNLSGGELKRIEIATILARQLKLSIYDEPEAGIDLWSFSKLTESFRDFHEKDDTVVIISHQERIMEFVDEIILMRDGMIAQEGPSEEMLPIIMQDLDVSCTWERSEPVGTDQ